MINAFQNVITLTKGDDCTLVIDITNQLGNAYKPADGDVCTLYVKKTPESGKLEEQEALITKVFDKDYTCKLLSADTKNLDVGTYKYGVVLTSGDKKFTVINPTDFIIQEGIT